MQNFEMVNFDAGEKYESMSLSGVFKTDDQKLHWLPIASRIQYKIATLCYHSYTKCYIYIYILTVYNPCHENVPHIFHKNQNLWTTNFSCHGRDTVKLIKINMMSVTHQPHLLSSKR